VLMGFVLLLVFALDCRPHPIRYVMTINVTTTI
jgi:hypothetical protein